MDFVRQVSEDRLNLDMSIDLAIDTRGSEDRGVRLVVCDSNSNLDFLELVFTRDEFMRALGGLSGIKCKANVRGLHRVGRKVERKSMRAPIPEDLARNLSSPQGRKALADYLNKHHEFIEWEIWDSFSSKNSVEYTPNGTFVNFTLRRFV